MSLWLKHFLIFPSRLPSSQLFTFLISFNYHPVLSFYFLWTRQSCNIINATGQSLCFWPGATSSQQPLSRSKVNLLQLHNNHPSAAIWLHVNKNGPSCVKTYQKPPLGKVGTGPSYGNAFFRGEGKNASY